jgi:transcriptional regulator with XRE-family HTH domain
MSRGRYVPARVPVSATSLRDARRAAGLSQAELGEAAGITGQAVSQIETGVTRRLEPVVARRFAKALGRAFDEPTGEWIDRHELAARLRRSAAQLVAEAELLERGAA